LQQNTGGSRAINEGQVVSMTEAYSGTFTLSAPENWTAVVATFAASGNAATPDFTLSVTPDSQTVVQGNMTTYNVSITAENSFSGTVNLTAAGFGAGASGSFNPATITGSGSSILTANTTSAAQTGTFPLTLTGSSGTLNHAQTVMLNVNPAGSNPGIALIQSTAVQGSGVSSLSRAFSSANTAGNMIIAFVRMSTASQSVNVTDTAGNVYTDAVSQAQTADGHQIHIFYASNIRADANTVTATFSNINNYPWLAIYEYSGVGTLDAVAHAQGSDDTANTGPTSVTTAANKLIFAGMAVPNDSNATVSVPPGSDWTAELQNPMQFGSRAATANMLSSSPGPFSGIFNLSGTSNWCAVVAVFKQ
jgi:hypothetical protein